MTTTISEPEILAAPTEPERDRWRWMWLAIGAGLLPFTMFQTIVPIAAWMSHILILRFVRTTRARVSLPLVAAVGYGSAVLALRGIWDDPYLVSLPGLGLALVYGADKLLMRRLPVMVGTLALPAADTALSYLAALDHSVGFASWGALGYTQVPNAVLTQTASLFGVWGIGFLIMWTASVVNTWWEHDFRVRPIFRPIVVWAAVLVALTGYGSVRLAFPVDSPGVQVAAITLDPELNEAFLSSSIGPATPAGERDALTDQYLDPIVDDLFARTREAARAGARIVAWSEAAAFVFDQDEAALLERGSRVAMEEGIYLEMGVISILPRDETPFNENRSVLFGPDGALLWDYPKSSVVAGDGNEPGPGVVPVVDTPYGRLAVVICFDGDFPPLVRQASRAGADILLLPSSDWDLVDRPHADMAVLRAVESGMSVVRPTRQGVSTMLDPVGRTLAYGPDYFSGEVPILMGTVPTERRPTVYTAIGDVVGYGSAMTLVALAGVVIARSASDRRRRQPPVREG
jgi:apolipoprotein N-acyltransferase